MEQRITMVTLGVADLDRARAFYAALGWTAAAHLEATSFYQAGGMVVGLYGRAALAEEAGIADAGATFFRHRRCPQCAPARGGRRGPR